MTLAFGQVFVLLILLAIGAAVVFGIAALVRYAKRREADRREMLELMREQNWRGNE